MSPHRPLNVPHQAGPRVHQSTIQLYQPRPGCELLQCCIYTIYPAHPDQGYLPPTTLMQVADDRRGPLPQRCTT